jgi:hypothetical protein
VEAYHFFTLLLLAMGAVLQAPAATALLDLAGPAIAYLLSPHGETAIAVDIFRLKVKAVLLGIKGGGFFPGGVIIIFSGQKSGAVGANKPAVSNHSGHEQTSFTVAKISTLHPNITIVNRLFK